MNREADELRRYRINERIAIAVAVVLGIPGAIIVLVVLFGAIESMRQHGQFN